MVSARVAVANPRVTLSLSLYRNNSKSGNGHMPKPDSYRPKKERKNKQTRNKTGKGYKMLFKRRKKKNPLIHKTTTKKSRSAYLVCVYIKSHLLHLDDELRK